MTLPLTTPPDRLCILRLSALGDISHTLPVVRTIQQAWPQTRITWIIGKREHELVGDIPEIEFIVFDKSAGIRAFMELRSQLRGRHFDLLLHMQTALRASIASLFVSAPIKLGFDRERAKDLQWLFTNHKIAFRPRQHVLDGLFGFAEALGITERTLEWNIPIPTEAAAFATAHLPRDKKVLVISPCSSVSQRNWTIAGYAAVADHAAEKHQMQVVLCGGATTIEHAFGEEIMQRCQHTPINLIGRTNLKQLLAVLEQADLIIAPDSGPAHLGTAVATPVIGLYAATNPERAAPYLERELVVNRYQEAISLAFGTKADDLPWGTRARQDRAMKIITAPDVIQKIDLFFNTTKRTHHAV